MAHRSQNGLLSTYLLPGSLPSSQPIPPPATRYLTDMDQLAQLPDDFFVTSSQFTKTVYPDEYLELDVTQDSFAQKRKVIIITGASQGLGRNV